MKVRYVGHDIPGSFIIEAETENDRSLLKLFLSTDIKKYNLGIQNSCHTSDVNGYTSFMFGFSKK